MVVDEEANEITAIPALLKLLEFKGCPATIEAMRRRTAIAWPIIAREADYTWP